MADDTFPEIYEGGILSGVMQRAFSQKGSGLRFLMGPEFFSGLTPYQSHQDTVAGVAVPPVLPAGIMPLTVEQLRAIMPGAKSSDIEAAQMPLAVAMAGRGILLPAQQAAFLGQVAAEGGLRGGSENMYYRTPGQLMAAYGHDLFPTSEAEKPYRRDPEKLANYVYEGKNGNVSGSDDGWIYRGRGPIQVTGRANYRAVGFENNPEALETPYGGAQASAAWWDNNRLPPRTASELDRQEYDRITRTVNKRELDANRRWQAYQRALGVLR